MIYILKWSNFLINTYMNFIYEVVFVCNFYIWELILSYRRITVKFGNAFLDINLAVYTITNLYEKNFTSFHCISTIWL